MEVRAELKYTEEHEWLSIQGNKATLGITDFAQNKLGDIVFVELPEVGTIVEAGETIGNIESVKAVSEIFCPVAGEVTEVNKDLEDEPDLVNTSCFDDGWIVKIRIDSSDLTDANLMSDEEYTQHCANE
ncbi:MAG: glycine cleavage system protein GcvH [bacterium]|nr:glycine cleavage system protein GcvH [bacterium]